MQLNLLSFGSLVQTGAAAVQSSARALLDLTIGSTLRAIIEAGAGQALWLQYLILQVLSAIRAATSNGSDLDSWMADFGLVRLGATASTGNVTFSRYTATNAALILPGTLVRTSDGTQTFVVTTNTGNSVWNAGLGGYVIAATVASATVPVAASITGVITNVQANTITLIASAISGVDTVTNALAFTNALPAETDAALRTRFAAYLASLTRATLAAIGYAISSVQPGLTYQIIENYDGGGNYRPGRLTVYVDDGTGSPPPSLTGAVSAAVDLYRGATIQWAVSPPSVLTANVSLTITTATGYTHSTVTAQVATAITAAIQATPMGGTLAFYSLARAALNVAGVTNLSGLTVNSGAADLAGASGQVIRPGTISVS